MYPNFMEWLQNFLVQFDNVEIPWSNDAGYSIWTRGYITGQMDIVNKIRYALQVEKERIQNESQPDNSDK